MRTALLLAVLVSGCSSEPLRVSVGDACDLTVDSLCDRFVSCGFITEADQAACVAETLPSCCTGAGCASVARGTLDDVIDCSIELVFWPCERLEREPPEAPAVCYGVAAPR